jgi:signal transduction histidine kinase
MTASGRMRGSDLAGYRRNVAPTGRRPPLRNAHLAALDLVTAAAVLVVALAPQMRTSAPVAPGVAPYQTPGWVIWAAWAVAAGVALPILVRRRWPVPALGAIIAVSAAAVLLLDMRWPGTLAPLAGAALALYSVALTTSGRLSVAALVLCLVVTGGAEVLRASLKVGVVSNGSPPAVPWPDAFGQIGFGLLMLGTAWTVGVAVRHQRAYAASTAEQAARQALSDERRRIARELHDIVAHSMSLIAVKAGIANHVAEARPEEAREALRLIEATSRGALVDLRGILGVLRADADTSPNLDPSPGLAGLAMLADRAASAGVRIEVAMAETAGLSNGTVPEGVQLSAYRIVQEALTNVVRHAGAVACRVAVTVTRDEVRIEVTNDIRAGRPARTARAPGTAWSGCANGSRPTAERSPPGHCPAAASPSTPRCPTKPLRHDTTADPGARRRRRGTAARQLPVADRHHTGHDRRRRGEQRRGGRRVGPPGTAGRRPHGRTHAADRRGRGDAAHLRIARHRRRPGPHPHHIRP